MKTNAFVPRRDTHTGVTNPAEWSAHGRRVNGGAMPQNEEALREALHNAHARMNAAADWLAFDVTIRADNPHAVTHSPASPELTARLKAEYVAAYEAERAAYEAWKAAADE